MSEVNDAIGCLENAIWKFGLKKSTDHMRDVHKTLQKVLNKLQKYKEEEDDE